MTAQRALFIGGQLVLLALGAFYAASAVNGLVAVALRPEPEVSLTEAPPEVTAPARQPRTYYDAIVQNDIFNPPRAVERAQPARQSSPLKAKLLGTAPGTGMASFAIIEDQTNRKQALYQIGDPFQDRVLARVAWDHVVLKHGESEEILKMEEPTSGPSTTSSQTASVSQTAEENGIQALSETEYVIDRAEVDAAMDNLNQLFTQIRAVPHFQDGQANGFRLFAIRRNSVFDKIGLKNGDIISSINGNELSDPARAMTLLQGMSGESSVQVEVTRNRQPVTLSYEIR